MLDESNNGGGERGQEQYTVLETKDQGMENWTSLTDGNDFPNAMNDPFGFDMPPGGFFGGPEDSMGGGSRGKFKQLHG